MSTTTQKQTQVSAELRRSQQSSWIARATRFLEDAFAGASRKPHRVYNARYGKSPVIFEKHRADYDRLLAQGADLSAILDGIYAMAIELERRRDTALPLSTSLDELHQQLIEAECAANALQLKAARTNAKGDVDAAIAASVREVRVEKQFLMGLHRRADSLTMLDRHVGYVKPIGAA